MKINYHNKIFKVVSNSNNGELTPNTTFKYEQLGNIVFSNYENETIIKGHLLGVVCNDGHIEMRYHQINKQGELKTGRCISKPEILKNGKIRLHESWQWLTDDFTKGTSI